MSISNSLFQCFSVHHFDYHKRSQHHRRGRICGSGGRLEIEGRDEEWKLVFQDEDSHRLKVCFLIISPQRILLVWLCVFYILCVAISHKLYISIEIDTAGSNPPPHPTLRATIYSPNRIRGRAGGECKNKWGQVSFHYLLQKAHRNTIWEVVRPTDSNLGEVTKGNRTLYRLLSDCAGPFLKNQSSIK